MRAQITGLDAAQKNVKDGVSLVKTAEGAMQEIQDMLNRMDYLATQSANGTYDNEVDRKNLQKEVDALKSEINRIADSANFNGINLLDGKVGFNKDAFTVSDVAAQGKVDGNNLLSNANFPATTVNGVHETVAGNTTQTTVSFSLAISAVPQEALHRITAAANPAMYLNRLFFIIRCHLLPHSHIAYREKRTNFAYRAHILPIIFLKQHHPAEACLLYCQNGIIRSAAEFFHCAQAAICLYLPFFQPRHCFHILRCLNFLSRYIM